MPTSNAVFLGEGTRQVPHFEQAVRPGEPAPVALHCCIECGKVRFDITGPCNFCGQLDTAGVMYVPEAWAAAAEHCIDEIDAILASDEASLRPDDALDRVEGEVFGLILRVGKEWTPHSCLEEMWSDPEPVTLGCCTGCGKAQAALSGTCDVCGERETVPVVYVPEPRAKQAEACVEAIDPLLNFKDPFLRAEDALDRIGLVLYEFRHPRAPGACRS
jgi:hypothetical protein